MKINKIGIELEGYWENTPKAKIYGDGSVIFNDVENECHCECQCSNLTSEERENDESCWFCRDGCDGGCDQDNPNIGEISSEPLELYEALKFIDENYPSKTNKTCGFHIHISFKDNLTYMQLMNKRFHTFIVKQFTEWGKDNKINKDSEFWKRLNGECDFCYANFKADTQVKLLNKESDRYCHLNYCFSLRRYKNDILEDDMMKTIELRLLPAFHKKELAIKALIFYIHLIETYLAKVPKEKAIYNVITLKEYANEFRETIELCV